MTAAGYSGTPLPKKLGIREGSKVGLRHAPAGFRTLLAPLPDDVALVGLSCAEHVDGDRRHDVVLLFTDDRETMCSEIESLAGRIEVDGGVWACWPKMKSPLFRGLRESDVRAAGLATGLVDNKICAVDDDWSGLRFVFRLEDRAGIRADRGDTE